MRELKVMAYYFHEQGQTEANFISPADYARVRAVSNPHRWRSFLPEDQRETQSAQGEKSNSDEQGQEHQREICPLLPRPYRRRLWIGYFQLTPAYPVVLADHHLWRCAALFGGPHAT